MLMVVQANKLLEVQRFEDPEMSLQNAPLFACVI